MARNKISKNKIGLVLLSSIGLLTILYFGLDSKYIEYELVPLASYPKGTNFSAIGFSEVNGISILRDDGSCVRAGGVGSPTMCLFICTQCVVPPEAQAKIDNCNANPRSDCEGRIDRHYANEQPWYSFPDGLRAERIVNDNGEYVPYDSEDWIDNFSEVKRINPSDTWKNNYYIDTPVYSDYDLQQELSKKTDEFEEKLNTINTEIADIHEQNAELEKLVNEYENEIKVFDIKDENDKKIVTSTGVATASLFSISQEFFEYVFTGDFDALNDSKFFTLYAVIIGGMIVLSIISSKSRNVVYYG